MTRLVKRRRRTHQVRSRPANSGESQPPLLRQRPMQKEGIPRKLIVNGEIVLWKDHPYFALPWPVLSSLNANSAVTTTATTCGATLIHDDLLVTAAHCQGAFNYGVTLDGGDVVVEVMEQRRHVDFNLDPTSIRSDILVMKLNESLKGRITPVLLNTDPNWPDSFDMNNYSIASASPSSSSSTLSRPLEQPLWTLGFGRTQYSSSVTSSVLRQANLTAVDALTCQQLYDDLPSGSDYASSITIGPDVLCAASLPYHQHSSICQGDSGGPLLAKASAGNSPYHDSMATGPPMLVGVSSFTYECRSDIVPNGFARISTFADWMGELVCELSSDPPLLACPLVSLSRSSPASNLMTDPVLEERLVGIVIDFQYDYYPEETTFAVRNLRNNQIEYAGPYYVPRRRDRRTSTLWLAPGNYTLEVYDTAGDGLVDSPELGNGWYQILARYSEMDLTRDVTLAVGGPFYTKRQATVFSVELEKFGDTFSGTGFGLGAEVQNVTNLTVSTQFMNGGSAEEPLFLQIPSITTSSADSASASLIPLILVVLIWILN